MTSTISSSALTECHSTNLNKGYDPVSDSYNSSWSEKNVGCEACHGPGSVHLTWAKSKHPEQADDNGLLIHLRGHGNSIWRSAPTTGKPQRVQSDDQPHDQATELSICARCHSRRGQLWPEYRYGEALDQTHRLALLEPSLYFPGGQIKVEVYVYGSFLQSAMYRAGVSCSDCHYTHGAQLKTEGNALCTRCHMAQRTYMSRER